MVSDTGPILHLIKYLVCNLYLFRFVKVLMAAGYENNVFHSGAASVKDTLP